MNRKYYLILILVLSVSVLLLGLSYSKDSSINKYTDEFTTYDHNLKIVTSDKIKETTLTDSLIRDISVINKGPYKTNFAIEVITDSLEDLSYTINDGQKNELNDKIIYTQELDTLGSNNDLATLRVTIYNENNKERKITLRIHEQVNLLKDKIITSPDVYHQTEVDNYIYYGENANNYANYNGLTYRIVGLVNNNIYLISESQTKTTYNPTDDNYLPIDLYIATFNNSSVTINNSSQYKTWLNDSFWLLNTYGQNMAYYVDNGKVILKNKNTNLFAKKIIKIYIDTEIILGDGSKNNPYEVVYDG